MLDFLCKIQKTKKVSHLDSHLLGDRIKEPTLKVTDELLHVSFLEHTNSQAMSEYPSKKVNIYLHVENIKFKICSSHNDITRYLSNKYQEEFGEELVEGINYFVQDITIGEYKHIFIYLQGSYFCGSGGCSGELLIDDGGGLRTLKEFSLLRAPFYAIVDKDEGIISEVIVPVSFINLDRWDTYYDVYPILERKTKHSIYPDNQEYKKIKNKLGNTKDVITLFKTLNSIKPCPQNKIDIFDEFNPKTKLPKKFREILLAFNKNISKEEYHKAVGKFDETYYFNQLTFLAKFAKRCDLKSSTKQFIQEAMMIKNRSVSFSLEDIKTLKYIDIVQQNKHDISGILKFKIILKDKTIIDASYLYKTKDFSFFG